MTKAQYTQMPNTLNCLTHSKGIIIEYNDSSVPLKLLVDRKPNVIKTATRPPDASKEKSREEAHHRWIVAGLSPGAHLR